MRFRIDIYSDKKIKVSWKGFDRILEPSKDGFHSLYTSCQEKELKIEELNE